VQIKKFTKKILFPLALIVFVLYLATSYYILYSIIYNQRQPLTDFPENYNLTYKNVSFTPRGENINLKAWLFPSNSEYYIIFVHGIGANRVSNKDTLKLAKDLIGQGYNILMFDQRAQGESEGEISSASWFEKDDILGAFDYLVKEKKILTTRIGVYGSSMGGAASILAASIEPRIRALVVDSPFANAKELISQETALTTGLPKTITNLFLPPLVFFAKTFHDINIPAMSPEQAVKKINFPILIIHGTGDKRVPYAHGQRIYKNAARSSNLWLVEGATHTKAYSADPKAYVDKISTYFDLRFLF
jgi:uncharacterized protein